MSSLSWRPLRRALPPGRDLIRPSGCSRMTVKWLPRSRVSQRQMGSSRAGGERHMEGTVMFHLRQIRCVPYRTVAGIKRGG